MKRRPGIISDSLDQTMLHGVPVNVIDASLEVLIVPASVLPVSTLPNASFVMAHAGWSHGCFITA
jgi:hypothetical protein